MNRAGIDLHQNQQKTFVLIIAFSLVLILSTLILISSQKDEISHLDVLRNSSYLYSAETHECIGQDDYYVLDAGIAFGCSPESETSINADVIMQTSESIYTDLVRWNANRLSVHEVAITKNIARTYGIKKGDQIYSKHIVDGNTIAYTVSQILPDVLRFRITEGKKFTNGIIVMGYDGLYTDHITHSTIVFTNEPLDEFSQKHSQIPQRITYRESEIKLIVGRVFSTGCIVFGCSALITFIFVMLFAKDVQHNYRRMIMLGFSKRLLVATYRKHLYGTAAVSMFIYAVLSSAVLCYLGCGFGGVKIVICTIFIDIFTMLIASILCQRQAWRE